MKLLLAAVVIIVSWCGAEARGWRGIVPLHSQRSDVERLLGPPSGDCKCFYETESEWVRVVYATAPCVDYPSGWNVAKDTVLTIRVHPENQQKFSDLKLTTSNFYTAADDTFTTYYSDRIEGVEYTVSSEKLVSSVAYFPSSKDSHLRCPCYPALDESIQRSVSWDTFQFKTIGWALDRVDNFIIALQNNQIWTGFIVLYRGKQTSGKQASAYQRSIMRHVIETRGMPAARVKLIDGGYRDEPAIELFLLHDSLSPPEPRATWAPCRK